MFFLHATIGALSLVVRKIRPMRLAAPRFCAVAAFDGQLHKIAVRDSADPTKALIFDAYNNVDSRSRGKWPDGTFSYERSTKHPDDGPNSPYGSHGNVIFTVPGRSDMGVHSGRADRRGPQHPTMGCIRTMDDGVAALLRVVHKGHVIKVLNNVRDELQLKMDL